MNHITPCKYLATQNSTLSIRILIGNFHTSVSRSISEMITFILAQKIKVYHWINVCTSPKIELRNSKLLQQGCVKSLLSYEVHCGWNKCRLRIFGSGLLTFGCNVGDESGSNQVNWLFECIPLNLCSWYKKLVMIMQIW